MFTQANTKWLKCQIVNVQGHNKGAPKPLFQGVCPISHQITGVGCPQRIILAVPSSYIPVHDEHVGREAQYGAMPIN